MDTIYSTMLAKLHLKRKITLTVVGLDGVGKTRFVSEIAGLPMDRASSVCGMRSSNLEQGRYSIELIDLPGAPCVRHAWEYYYPISHGILFVYDATDMERMDEANHEMEKIFEVVGDKPVLILTINQDKDNAMTDADICKMSNLLNFQEHMKAECLDKSEKSKNQLKDDFNILIDAIDKDFHPLNKGVIKAKGMRDLKRARTEEEMAMKEREQRLFGPPGKSKHSFFFSMFMMFCFGYPVYLFRVLPYTLDFQFAHFFLMINSVVMIYCLFKSYTMDPGFLPKNLGDYDKALKQATLFVQWKNGESSLSRLCHMCRLITAFYGAFFSWYVNQYLHTDYLLALGGIISFIFSMTNLGLSGSMVYSAAANITTNERINGKRYSYLKDGNGNFYNPFNQGPVKNLFEFFHMKEPLVLDSDPSQRYGNALYMV